MESSRTELSTSSTSSSFSGTPTTSAKTSTTSSSSSPSSSAIVIVVLTIIVVIVALSGPFLSFSSSSSATPLPSFPLVIVILSARSHFELRAAIRDTWLADIRQNPLLNNRVLVKFVLGNHACPWPPGDHVKRCLPRLDPTSRRRFRRRAHYAVQTLRENKDGLNVAPTPTTNFVNGGVFCNSKELHAQVDIHVLENIFIDQIGTPDFGHPTRITLFDYSTGDSLFTITSQSPNRPHNRKTKTTTEADGVEVEHLGFAYIPITPIALPAEFRGYFLVSFGDVRKKEGIDGGGEEEDEDDDEGRNEDEVDDICIPWKPHSSRTNDGRYGYSLVNADGRLFYFPRVILRRRADGFDEAASTTPFDAATTNAGFVSFRFKLVGGRSGSRAEDGDEQRIYDDELMTEVEEEEEYDDDEEEEEEEEEELKIGEREWPKVKERRLTKEASDFGDVVFVDVVDTYANLPTKLLLAAKAFEDDYDFDFLIKTDDDVFLRVDALIDVLRDYGLFYGDGDNNENNNNNGKSNNHDVGNGGNNKNDNEAMRKTYLGRFRRDWAVMRAGKWAETRYQGNGYSPFACGATYGVSADVVSWLATNAASLGRFQGEDVSMGFWTTALGADLIDDLRFACGKDDDYGGGVYVNSVELSAQEIRREHKLASASSELKVKLLKQRQLTNPSRPRGSSHL